MAEKVVAINRVTAREGEITISSNHKSSSILNTSLSERKQNMAIATIEIKAIKVRKVNSNKSLKAYVDICIDEAIIIKNFKVIEGENGLFVGKPSEKSKTDEKYYETVRCTNKDVEDDLSNTILAAYKREV